MLRLNDVAGSTSLQQPGSHLAAFSISNKFIQDNVLSTRRFLVVRCVNVNKRVVGWPVRRMVSHNIHDHSNDTSIFWRNTLTEQIASNGCSRHLLTRTNRYSGRKRKKGVVVYPPPLTIANVVSILSKVVTRPSRAIVPRGSTPSDARQPPPQPIAPATKPQCSPFSRFRLGRN